VGETLSNDTRDPADAEAWTGAHLTRVLAAHAPGEPPARHALVDLDEVQLGRGDATGHRRAGARLRVDLADAWASQDHARLTRALGRWQIEDLGAKNGTHVNGTRVERTILADGDVVEIGRTFFVFTAELDWTRGTPPDAGPDAPLATVATLVPWFADALAQLAVLAPGPTSIVLTGATGTGKEVVARAIHAASGRPGAFVPVNCGAIPRDLVESTLFGHRRGAFSGAIDDEAGLVRAADRGTLFLDEIGDLPAPAQAALLRVLQEREVTAVGATRPVGVDVRVICATHRDLAAMTAAGAFRADLLHRLRGFAIALPALAERRADLGVLVGRLIERHAAGRPIALHPRVARALFAHPWPGNVRELEQVLAAAIGLARDGTITAAHLPPAIAEAVDRPAPPPPGPGDAEQRERLVALLAEHRGSIRAVARALGKDPVQIRRWLGRYGVDAAAYRG
jgi:transcriptional regulator of acetoin/glycerol metabolism